MMWKPLTALVLSLVLFWYFKKEHASVAINYAKTNTTINQVSNNSIAISYDSSLKVINKERIALKKKIGKDSIALAKDASLVQQKIVALFNTNILPYWMGTPWDFNGTTNVPKEGNIACGYFCTTTLKHLEFNIKRTYLAQQASGVIMRKLISKTNIKNYINLTYDNFITTVKQKGKGLYMVGLDFHVGFLLHDGAELYFVHSNYINRKGVVKELAKNSAALKASKYREVGYLTNDYKFLSKWLNGKAF
jgi:hypothetical protein